MQTREPLKMLGLDGEGLNLLVGTAGNGEGWKGEGRLEETRTIIIFEDRTDEDYHDHES